MLYEGTLYLIACPILWSQGGCVRIEEILLANPEAPKFLPHTCLLRKRRILEKPAQETPALEHGMVCDALGINRSWYEASTTPQNRAASATPP